MKAPAFQFYADDFIGGTVAMTAEEVGAYMRLLCYQWGQGSIPSRQEQIDRIAGCNVTADVLAKFPNGKNDRMEAVRLEQDAFRVNRATAGRAGAKARWQSHGTAIVLPMANGMANDGSPPPSPSPTPTPPPGCGEEWIAGLEKMEAYRGIDIRIELGKAQAWCREKAKACTNRFFINWLKTALTDARTTITANGTNPKPAQESSRNVGTLNEGRWRDYANRPKPKPGLAGQG